MKMNIKNKDYYNNISEDECYGIGQPEKKRFNKKKALIALLTIIATLFCAALITLLLHTMLQPKPPVVKHLKPLGKQNLGIEYSYTEKLDTIIEGLNLTLYIPHNAIPTLTIGSPAGTNLTEESVLAFRAADLGADLKTLIGLFVCDGVVYQSNKDSSSKLGFCAIIDGEITIGTAESTSLFEKAIERKGGFFRQHSLVANDTVTAKVDKHTKKTLRRALCHRGDQVFVAVCTDVSMYNLAQALAILDVDNAIYLLGGGIKTFNGWWRDINDNIELFRKTEKPDDSYPLENYIVWKKITN